MFTLSTVIPHSSNHDTTVCNLFLKIVHARKRKRTKVSIETLYSSQKKNQPNSHYKSKFSKSFKNKSESDKNATINRSQAAFEADSSDEETEDHKEVDITEQVKNESKNHSGNVLNPFTASANFSNTSYKFGKIMLMDDGTNNKLASFGWANSKEVDLFGTHDGILKCKINDSTRTMETVGENVLHVSILNFL